MRQRKNESVDRADALAHPSTLEDTMSRLPFMFALSTSLCLITGCNKPSAEQPPEDAAVHYYKHWPSQDALRRLCADDRNGPLAKKRAAEAKGNEIIRLANEWTKVRVLEVKEFEGDREVTVELSSPNMTKLIEEDKTPIEQWSEAKANKRLEEALKAGAFEFRPPTVRTIRVVREDSKWKACPDLETQHHLRLMRSVTRQAKKMGIPVDKVDFETLQSNVCSRLHDKMSTRPKRRERENEKHELFFGCKPAPPLKAVKDANGK